MVDITSTTFAFLLTQLMIHQGNPAPPVPAAKPQQTAFFCKLGPRGGEIPRRWNLTFLLADSATKVQANQEIVTMDPGNILNGRSFVRFLKGVDNGYVAVTSKDGDLSGMMLSLIPSSDGKSYNAGLGELASEQAKARWTGYCLTLQSTNTKGDFLSNPAVAPSVS